MLRFEVLGPLRVLRAESELDLGYPQARAPLGVLRPPASAPNAVRLHVGALRKLLEPGRPARARAAPAGPYRRLSARWSRAGAGWSDRPRRPGPPESAG
ncbi:hypothetical protein ABZV75_21780 [Streptomyces flaveolus]|uniref:hypothetical protein n=1 Tax=Streptomyces flaveolus TaxID=67297 RepID=UPI00339E214F